MNLKLIAAHCIAVKKDDRTRTRLSTELRDKDVSVMSIILNKQKVYAHLRNEKVRLYNYVTNILFDKIINKRLLIL